MHEASTSRFVLGGLVALLGLLTAPLAPAATTALIMDGTGTPLSSPDGGDGYRFSIDSYLSVVALGYFDFEGDGLIDPHNVGLWDSNGNLLGSILVPSGTWGYLEDDFRWVTLPTPIILAPGNYTVSGVNGADPVATLYPYTMAPEITYIDGAWSDSPTLDFPEGTLPEARLGANIQYDVLPEPSTAALILVGAIGAAAARRRRLSVEE